MIDAKGNSTPLQSLVPAVRTSSGDGVSADMKDYIGGAEATLDVGAASGTTPTLNVKLQDSEDDSSFADIVGATFAEVTAANKIESIRFDVDAARRHVRAVATIAGSSPSFACGVTLKGIKQEA